MEARELFLAGYDAYADAIYRFCLLRVFSKEIAEDLTQECFVRFWKYLQAGNEVQYVRIFLYTVARRLIIDHVRKKKEDRLDVLLERGEIPEPAHSGREEIERGVGIHEILRTFHQLRDEDREMIVYRYIEDLEPREIAEITGMSANAVSVRIHRAVKNLQEHFHNHE